MDLDRWLSAGVAAIGEWEAGFGAFEQHPSLQVSDERFAAAFGELTGRLRDNYPFFHPSCAGQMLKPPHPAAVAGYLTNHGCARSQVVPTPSITFHGRNWRLASRWG